MPQKPPPWTKDEDKILLTRYPELSIAQIHEQCLPDKPETHIRSRLKQLGVWRAPATRTWTPGEDAVLAKYFPSMPATEVQAKYFPKRTPDQVRLRAKALGLKRDGPAPWTEQDDQILILNSPDLSIAEIQRKYLPDRTYGDAKARARELGISVSKKPEGRLRRGWTRQETDLLVKYYNKIPLAELVKKYLPGKTEATVMNAARAMGLAKARWSEDEENLLKTYYPTMTAEELIEKYLPGYTVYAIQSKAKNLGLKKDNRLWTEQEIEILKTYSATLTVAEIQKRYLPRRTIDSIRTRISSMDLQTVGPPRWTQEEDDLLRTNIKAMTFQELHERLFPDRPAKAIQMRAARLGLVTPRKDWTPDEIAVLNQYDGKLSAAQIAHRYLPDRTSIAVRQKLMALHKQKSTREKDKK